MLFREPLVSLPRDYTPAEPAHFRVQDIYLAKGALVSDERRDFAEGICAALPNARIHDCRDVPHNRIKLPAEDPLAMHKMGKHALVFGELGDAVRFSDEADNTCPNYWHFSPYGFCPYGCNYCYLAGTRGVWHSPTVKIFVNLGQMLKRINDVAHKIGKPTAFYVGKLQDGLALDPLTAYSTVLVPFFAQHPYARQIILTKSASVERLLKLEHNRHTILSWSLNPPEVAGMFEQNVPTVLDRVAAMQACAKAGYPVRAVIMPVIPIEGWETIYTSFMKMLLEAVPVQRLTIGGICIYQTARSLMNRKIGVGNAIAGSIDDSTDIGDGRARYSRQLRMQVYDHVTRAAREINPDLEVALCLEEQAVWQELGMREAVGRCNCVL
jgi:spore photoproduct lyase